MASRHGSERLQIGEFAELVGLSVPQLRRYDRLRLLEPTGRSDVGYRYYTTGQTGTARVIALLRAVDMPIAEIRRILTGTAAEERQRIFHDHRARLEARLDEVRRLLDAVDALAAADTNPKEPAMEATTDLSAWLHVLPKIPVTDLDRSLAHYEEALGLRVAWKTIDGQLAALASGDVEILLLIPWTGDGPPPVHEQYVFVEDPDALFAELSEAGAEIIEPVETRGGMRGFRVRDLDGHIFTLARPDESLRDFAELFGLTRETIQVDLAFLRKPRLAGEAGSPPM